MMLRAGLSVFAFLFALGLLEVGSRPLAAEDDIRTEKRSPHRINSVCEFDADLGWKNRPHIEIEQGYIHANRLRKVLEKTNSQGLRSSREYLLKKPRGAFRVVTLGCSRTFGLGVDQGETYSDYMEKFLNEKLGRQAEVLNFGVNAFGLDQMSLMFETYAKNVEPDLVMLQLYGPSVDRIQYDSNWHTPKPAFRLVDGELVLENVPVPRKRFQGVGSWLVRHSVVFALIKRKSMEREQVRQKKRQADVRTQDLHLLATKILERLKQQTDAAEVPLVVFVWGPGRGLMPIATDAGVDVIHLDDYEKESPWIEKSPLDNPPPVKHWSAHGNRYVATALCNYVLQAGIETVDDRVDPVPK